ncbi:hypothetical protein AC579_10268 [Pseudocercospora musae]|uniref:amidase n=1 Tax=Pseudocercospora musae TaxID=113226 RepID=A0A139I5J6_9PEZI|nr:hypothetical protein AC579_10268 [Pseudocercospora musae]
MGSVERLPAWKQQAASKRASQYESIPKQWRLPDPLPQPRNTYEWLKASGLLSDQEVAVSETTDVRSLLDQMASGQLTAEAVVSAYCHRTALAQQLIRCCTEMFFDEAIEDARKLDQYFRENGKLFGPLHGIPISLKDGFSVKGQDSTLGWVSEIGKPAESEDLLTRTLRKQGAVPYCKTNIPQSLMMSDSYNHIFKQSLNALNDELVSGGSSGGEGAIVGARASPIGIGTDIGGSVRIPANLQGLYGLSPSTGRVPWMKSGDRSYIVPSVAGPLTTSLSSLELFMEGMLAAEPWKLDPVLIPVGWRKEIAAKPTRALRIGYYFDDGAVRVQPPLEEAVRKAVNALRKAGHEMIEWDTTTHKDAYYNLWQKAVLADGGRRCQLLCDKAGQPLIRGMLVGKPEDELSTVQGEQLHAEIRAYQRNYMQRWEDVKLDALIMPVQPWVGFKPKTWVESSQYCGYTAIFNLLDWAGITVPVEVGKAESIDVNKDYGDGRGSWAEHKPRNEPDRFNWHQYDPKLINDQPVTVQIVGGRYGEERAVAAAKALEEALGV